MVEARNRVAHLRGVLQRLLALLWEKQTWLPISDHELVWSALPLFSSLGSIPLRTDCPGLFTADYGFSSSCSVVWLTSYSSRVDSAMRGSSISFLTRASIAWLDSCFGWF